MVARQSFPYPEQSLSQPESSSRPVGLSVISGVFSAGVIDITGDCSGDSGLPVRFVMEGDGPLF